MKSVLVVDDEHDVLLAVEMLLSEEGYEVRTARNGKEALERLAEKLPSVVLLDVMMPVLSGLETLKLIRKDPEYAKLPIVMMSAVKPPVEPKDAQWDHFLRKPFELDLLLQALSKVTKKKE